MPSILQKIIAEKHQEVKQHSQETPSSFIEHLIAETNADTLNLPRGFYHHLKTTIATKENAVIAEIKKASPSQGIICENFDPAKIANSYEKHGATCLSVLTDELFFQGNQSYLREAREHTQLPVLRKDFIIDAYQVYESRAIGADCILLIAACLSRDKMLSLAQLAYDLGMDVLFEIHNTSELDKLIGLPVRMIGINNRNLHTFEVNLSTTLGLVKQIPKVMPKEIIVITESGIRTRDDVNLMNDAGIHAFLVGESMMRHSNPGKQLATLFF